jgi:Bacterial regulatory proteins, gntR family
MFPISDATLSLSRIADYWSREIRPHASALELLKLLESAWWRGEFVTQEGASRLSLIRHLYNSSNDYVFTAGEESGPPDIERPDGIVEVNVRPRIRVPSTETEAWNDRDCALAYEDLAARPLLADLPTFAPTFAGICLSHREFIRWLERRPRPYDRPTFWAPSESNDKESRSNVSIGSARKRGRKPVKRERVRQAMLNDIEQGNLTVEKLGDMLEKELAERYKVSRDTARKARDAILSDYNSRQIATNDN